MLGAKDDLIKVDNKISDSFKDFFVNIIECSTGKNKLHPARMYGRCTSLLYDLF